MKACDMPMKEFISLCLPGQVDGRFGVVHHDEAGCGILHFFSVHRRTGCPLEIVLHLHRHMESSGMMVKVGSPGDCGPRLH